MKKATNLFWSVLAVGLLFSSSLVAQTKVTFNINSALYPDTLRPNHVVQLRGGVNGGPEGATTTPAISWDAASAVATNVGGDYWKLELTATPGAVIGYKYWAGYNVTTPLTNKGNGYTEEGWEGGSNRELTVPANDTTIWAWIGNTANVRPYTLKEDTVAVMFRVNVGSRVQQGLVTPGTTPVIVRGGLPIPGDWGDSGPVFDLEPYRVGDNYMYNKVIYMPKASPAATAFYKFFAADWESDAVGENGSGNRNFKVSTDTTLHWKFFNNEVPSAAPVITANATFRVNTGYMNLLGLYDQGKGDRVVIRGGGIFGGWAASADDANALAFDDANLYFSLTKEVVAPTGASTAYKYYIDYDASRLDAESDNFIPAYFADQGGFGYEEPLSTFGGNRIYTQNSETVRLEPLVYFNDVSASGVILRSAVVGGGPATVTFRVDMTPALSAAVTPMVANDSVFFSLESKLTGLTLGIASIRRANPNAFLMTKEGETNIYSYTLTLNADATINDFGFNFYYGKPRTADGNWVNSGNGTFDAGRRYYQYIQPASVGARQDDEILGEYYPTTWPATYTMNLLQWTTGDAPTEDQPDYKSLVSNERGTTKTGFALSQNYPNPFNPTTNISFTLPVASKVKLEVYNILGQRVATLINNELVAAGNHVRSFDAKKLASGMYIYRMTAGNFVSQRKMMLIK